MLCFWFGRRGGEGKGEENNIFFIHRRGYYFLGKGDLISFFFFFFFFFFFPFVLREVDRFLFCTRTFLMLGFFFVCLFVCLFFVVLYFVWFVVSFCGARFGLVVV